MVTRLMEFLGVPIPGLSVGTLFVANYAVFQAIVVFGGFDMATVAAFDELKETNYELAFMVLAFWFSYRLPATFLESSSSSAIHSAGLSVVIPDDSFPRASRPR